MLQRVQDALGKISRMSEKEIGEATWQVMVRFNSMSYDGARYPAPGEFARGAREMQVAAGGSPADVARRNLARLQQNDMAPRNKPTFKKMPA